MKDLFNLCKDKPWFSDVVEDSAGRYVVCAHFITLDVLKFVPQ